jgi:hypothetical protein
MVCRGEYLDLKHEKEEGPNLYAFIEKKKKKISNPVGKRIPAVQRNM